MFRKYFTVILLLFILMINATSMYQPNVSSDLCIKSDLKVYLKSLRRILEFCARNKYYLDMNFAFGLFLVNVNLKLALKNKRNRLPKPVFEYISTLLEENDLLVKFFERMVEQNKHSQEKLNKMIISLFSNEIKWMSRIRGFDTSLIKPSDIRSRSHFEDKNVTIKAYISNVDEMDNWLPQPRLSDLCMVSLASNRDHRTLSFPKCEAYEPCYDMLLNGTNFGYALSHRLLFLINARHGRGCSIYSQKQDRKLTNRFCRIAYDESKFIAAKGYKIIDLILEFISLCVIDGHAQFLRRDWILNSLQFQTPYGCFGVIRLDITKMNETSLPRASETWKLAKHMNHQILGGMCNGHVTSVAAAAISSAVRYILRTYY